MRRGNVEGHDGDVVAVPTFRGTRERQRRERSFVAAILWMTAKGGLVAG
jgi:hypothetical protein